MNNINVSLKDRIRTQLNSSHSSKGILHPEKDEPVLLNERVGSYNNINDSGIFNRKDSIKSCPVDLNYNNNNSMSRLNPNSQIANMSVMLNRDTAKKINDLDNSINQLNAKNDIIIKSLEKLRTPQTPVQILQPQPPVVVNSSKVDSSMISDNIIYREDINRLTDIIRHMENDLAAQRQRNYDLASENDRLNRENLALHIEIDKTNGMINQLKVKEHNAIESFNARLQMENKLQNNEHELNKYREENSKLQIDLQLLLSKHDTLKNKNMQLENELHLIQQVQQEKISDIETKLNAMTLEITVLRKDNGQLKETNEKYRCELNDEGKSKEEYKNKYLEQKSRNDLLNEKIKEIKEEFERYKRDAEQSEEEKRRAEELKKSKLESKNKIVSDLQRRIANYKNERLRKKNSE